MSVYMVSKDAILDILWDLRENDPFPEYRTAIREIERIPSVEAEPVVHAHWERFKHPSGTHGIRCSHCKTVNGRKSKHCPECGAHMDEEVAE